MFSNAIKLFSVSGFDIKVDPSWLVFASLVTWSLSEQYFPKTLPDASHAAYVTMGIFGMLGLFGSLLLHELAHCVVARSLGIPTKSITLFIFGGMAHLGAELSSARDELWIAIAGPIMSLSLAITLWLFSRAAVATGISGAAFEVISYLAMINLVLALFNLVPAFPLDGGRILRAYLWSRSGNVLSATQIAARSGTIFGYFLICLGFLALFQGAFLVGLWQLLIGGFVLVAARASYVDQLARAVFEGKSVADLMTRDAITVGPEMRLTEFAHDIMLAHNVTFVPVIEADVLLGHIEQSVLSRIDRENWENTRVGDVFVGLEADGMVSPDLLVTDLLNIITSSGRRKFMVVVDHQLLGVITLADLFRHLTPANLKRL